MERIQEAYKTHRGRYGYRRITAYLNKGTEERINHKKVYRIMKKMGLQARIRRKRKYYSKENNVAVVKPNLLNREFLANKLNQKWVTDITYLFYGNQRIYLSVIVDLYNREVVAYNMSKNNDNQLVIKTLQNAFIKTNNTKDILLHSDQGSQYTSRFYAATLSRNGIMQSMSNRGNCLDNAPCECFFSHLKSELIYIEEFTSLEHMVKEVEDYIKFYNNSRIQLRLKKMAPVEYRNHFNN